MIDQAARRNMYSQNMSFEDAARTNHRDKIEEGFRWVCQSALDIHKAASCLGGSPPMSFELP